MHYYQNPRHSDPNKIIQDNVSFPNRGVSYNTQQDFRFNNTSSGPSQPLLNSTAKYQTSTETSKQPTPNKTDIAPNINQFQQNSGPYDTTEEMSRPRGNGVS